MRESSLVPTNLLNWPRVCTRLPEEKLILIALWASPYLSCAGTGELPLRPLAATLGFSPEACATGIDNLAEASLITFDSDTSEIFINDWFRFHKFKTGVQQSMLLSAIQKVRSITLKNVILDKSSTCLPTTTSTSTSTNSKPSFGYAERLVGDDGNLVVKEKSAMQKKNKLSIGDLKGNLISPAEIASPECDVFLLDLPPNSALPPLVEPTKEKILSKASGDDKLQAACKATWEAYAEAIFARYKVRPNRAAKESALIKSFVNKAGQENAPKAIKFYVGMDDPVYIKTCHPLTLLARDTHTVVIKFDQKEQGVSSNSIPLVGRQQIRDVLSNMHHNFNTKDYRAGVDSEGRLID